MLTHPPLHFPYMHAKPAVTGATGNKELTVGAGLADDRKSAALLTSNYMAKQKAVFTLQNIPWDGQTLAEIWQIDDKNDYKRTGEVVLEDVENAVLELDCPPHTILFVQLSHKMPWYDWIARNRLLEELRQNPQPIHELSQ